MYFLRWFGMLASFINLFKRNEYFIYSKIVLFPVSFVLYSLIVPYGLFTTPVVQISIAITEAIIFHTVIRKHNPTYFPLRSGLMFSGLLFLAVTGGTFLTLKTNFWLANLGLVAFVVLLIRFNVLDSETIGTIRRTLNFSERKKITG